MSGYQISFADSKINCPKFELFYISSNLNEFVLRNSHLYKLLLSLYRK